MVAVKYHAIKDKSNKKPKVVYILTPCHQPTMLEVDAYHPEGHAVFKPEAIKAYSHYMRGVDMVDQQLHNLHTLCKTYKWYRKLAICLISQAIVNAHKVYQRITSSEISFLEFLHDTIALLVTQTPQIEYHNPLVPDDSHEGLTGHHFIATRKPAPNAKDQRPTKECRVCHARKITAKKGGAVKTVYIRPDCPFQPGLHPGECFKAYHTMLDYSQAN